MGTSERIDEAQATFETNSPAETMAVAAQFARHCQPNDVVGLTGTLGAGKTCFVKGMARGLEVEDLRQVTSPTFVLLQQYSGRYTLHHFDAYRLESADSMEEIGCEEIFDSGGVTVIEWADHVARCLPEEHFLWHLHIDGPRRRRLTLGARGIGPVRRLPAINRDLEKRTHGQDE